MPNVRFSGAAPLDHGFDRARPKRPTHTTADGHQRRALLAGLLLTGHRHAPSPGPALAARTEYCLRHAQTGQLLAGYVNYAVQGWRTLHPGALHLSDSCVFRPCSQRPSTQFRRYADFGPHTGKTHQAPLRQGCKTKRRICRPFAYPQAPRAALGMSLPCPSKPTRRA